MVAKSVQLLYFDGCPHWRTADRRLRAALDASSLTGQVEVRHRLVETPADAVLWDFRGSPTILVDGRDPWADPGASVGLSCRIYRTEWGRDGAPSIPQLAAALGA